MHDNILYHIVTTNSIEDFRLPIDQLEKPVDWNIVLAGAWNVAILTPQGVASRLFKLEQDVPVEVLVAVDVRAPVKVKHDQIVIQPSPTSLVISPEIAKIEEMQKAVEIAKRALT